MQAIDSLPFVDPTFDQPAAVSLRADPDGRPHVAYKPYLGPVRYAHRADDGWRRETATATAERNCALMLDSAGGPHVLFHAGLASRTNGSWSVNLHPLYYLFHVGGVLAPDGAVHAFVFQSFSGGRYWGETAYVLVRGTQWTLTTMEARDDAFTSPNACIAAALDAGGVPRVCVTNTFYPEIRYWADPRGAVSGTIPAARWGSLAIDLQGESRIAYYHTESHHLELAVFHDGSWIVGAVDTSGDVGAYASLAIDASGREHIAYYDLAAGDLRYATRSGPAAEWTHCTVDAAGDVGSWASLDVDAESYVHIAYVDATKHRVKYATTRSLVAVVPGTWTRVKSAFR